MKKIVSIILSVFLIAGMAGCSPDLVRVIDETKSQLTISIYGGGVGTAWLSEAIAAFEELYKDESFEEGKLGVEVHFDPPKAGTAGDALVAGLSGDTHDLFFTEAVYYYDLVSKQKVADITDIVTQPLSAFGETGSIADKMDPALDSFYKTSDGKYYALPFYDGYYGIIYNVDLFESENLYFCRDYRSYDNPDDMFVSSADEPRSYGPNGKTGVIDGVDYSADDGLPATYDDFFILCDVMLGRGITPFIWSGQYPGHTAYAAFQMWADYEGKDDFYLNYSFDGVETGLIDGFDGDGNPIYLPETTIDDSNGVLVQKQAGKYYALKFMERLMRPEIESNRYYDDMSFSPSLSQTAAQDKFLRSTVTAGNKIAMLIDGNWWEREADSEGSYAALEKYGKNKYNMRFGFMPFPKATDEMTNDKRTVVCQNDSICFINARSSGVQLQLAKLFMQYCHTERALSAFTVNTGMTRPFDYTVTDEQRANMTYFGRDICDLKSDGNVDIVYPYSDNLIFLNHFSSFHPFSWSWTISAGDIPAKVFKDKNLTAEEYFLALYPAYKTKWDSWTR